MELKIKMALHTNEFALKPIIETEFRCEIDDDQSLYHLEELFHFVVVQKLQKQQSRLRGIKDDE